ncbi:MAG: ribosome silencing factor [Candidatus Aquicultor sp.]
MESKNIAELAAAAASDKQASDIVIIDISKILIIADYFVICSGQTNRQVQTIAESVADKLREQKVRKVGIEGDRLGNWVLLDYGAVVIHVFTQDQREFYSLERLWADAPHHKWEETG